MRNTLLVGQALIDRARDLSDHTPEDIARACGYVGPGGRVLRKAFLHALVEARGHAPARTAAAVAGSASRGRQAEYRTRVHGNGNLLIGQAYTRRLGLEPGQECRIELHQETGTIWLRPLDQDDSDGGEAVEEAF
ncbi:MAG: AbrB family transcriptional regulator [Cyanobacteriota bacterium]